MVHLTFVMLPLKCSNTAKKRETISSLRERSPQIPRWKHLVFPAQIYHQTWKGQQMSARMGDSLCYDFLKGLFGEGEWSCQTPWTDLFSLDRNLPGNLLYFAQPSSDSVIICRGQGFFWLVISICFEIIQEERKSPPPILFLKISISEVPRGSGHCCSSCLLTFSLGAYWASQL